MKDRLRKALTIALLVGAFMFVTNLLVDNPYSHRLVRAMINDKVSSLTNLAVEFQAIEVKVFPLGVDLFGFKVTPNDSPETPLVETARLKLRVSIWSLLMGRTALSLVEAQELSVAYPLPETFKGIWRNPEPKPNDEDIVWPPESRLPVDRIVLINSKIGLRVPNDEPGKANEVDASFSGFNLDFQYDGWQDLELALDVRSANVDLTGDKLIREGAFQADIILSNGRLSSDEFKLESNKVKVDGTLSGKLHTASKNVRSLGAKRLFTTVLEAVDINLSFDVAGDLEVLAAIIGAGDTRGPAKGHGEFVAYLPLTPRAGTATWHVDGEAAVEDGRLDGFRLYDSKVHITVDEREVAFPEIKIIHDGQTLGTGRGSIQLDDRIGFDFKVSPERMPLTTLLGAVKVDKFDVLDADVSSQELSVRGQGKPFDLHVAGVGDFVDLRVPKIIEAKGDTTAKRVGYPFCRLKVDLRANEDRLEFGSSGGECARNASELTAAAKGDKGDKDSRLVSPLTLRGHTAFKTAKGMDLTIDAPDFALPLASAIATIDLKGTGAIKARVHGPYDAIVIDVDASGQDVSVHGIPLGQVSAHVDIPTKRNLLIAKNVKIRPKGGGQLAIPSGSLTLDRTLVVDAQVDADQISGQFFETLLAQYEPELGLRFALTKLEGSVRGSLKRPLALEGDAAIELADLGLQGEVLATKIRAQWQGNDEGWRIVDGLYQLVDFEAAVAAEHKRQHPPVSGPDGPEPTHWLERLGMSLDDHVVIKVRSKTPTNADGADAVAAGADHLASLPYVGKTLREAGIAGAILLNVDAEGTFNHLEGQFDGAIQRPTILASPVPRIQFKGFISGSKIDIPVLTHSGGSLRGRLDFDFMKPGVPFEWYLKLSRFDLRPLGGRLFFNDPRNYAYVSADWSLKGRFADWWRATGNLNLTEAHIKYVRDLSGRTEKVELANAFPTTMQFTKKGWHFADERGLILKGNDIMAQVLTENNRPPEKLNFKFKGELDVSVLKRLFPIIETARGRIDLTGSITGKVSDPQFDFAIRDRKIDPFSAAQWEPVTIGLIDIAPAFSNVRIDAHYRKGRFEINQLTANKGKAGRISVSGVFDPTQSDPLASRILISIDQAEVNRFPVSVIKSVDAIVSGDLVLTGNQLPLKLSGNLVANRIQSFNNFDIRSQIIDTIRRRKFNAPAAPQEPLLALDLQVTADNSIHIRNRNMVATLSADLQIAGTEAAPVVLGQIRIPKGSFNYKREFEIYRGTITFDEPVSPPDPKLDIMGEAIVGQYKVQTVISGYASNPTVALAIDPPTRQDGTPITKIDILLLLTTGQLPDAARNIGASGDAARSEAFNLLIGQFEEPIEKLFDLSGQTVIRQVYLDTYSSGEDGLPVARLNLPINLSEDLNFVFQVDDDANMKISSEYSLHESISVSGSFDKKKEDERQQESALPADTGVDLKFRFSFP